jgi:hypothetical protein
MALVDTFCSCIKKVSKSIPTRRLRKTTRTMKVADRKEQAAIAICTKSVLQTRGKTLKKFRCGKKRVLKTQRLKV